MHRIVAMKGLLRHISRCDRMPSLRMTGRIFLQLDQAIWFPGCLILSERASTSRLSTSFLMACTRGGEGAHLLSAPVGCFSPWSLSSSSEHLRGDVIPSPSYVLQASISGEIQPHFAGFPGSSHFDP